MNTAATASEGSCAVQVSGGNVAAGRPERGAVAADDPPAGIPVAGPGDARLRLGRELRVLRQAASLRVEDAAGSLGIAPSTLSRIENGWAPARPVYVLALLTAYGIGDDSGLVQRLTGLARAGQQASAWHACRGLFSADTQKYLDLEATARTVLCYSAQMVPSLVQTPEYAAAAFGASRPGLAPGQVRALAAVHAQRTARAQASGTPGLHLVADETALLRPVGGAAVHAGQLRYLAERAARPGTTLQILQLSGERQPLSPALAVLETGPGEPDIAFTAGVAGQAVLVRHGRDLAAARQVFAALTAAALPPEDSVILLGKISAQFNSPAGPERTS